MSTSTTYPPGHTPRLAALGDAVEEMVDHACGDTLTGADTDVLLETLASVTGAIGRLQAVQVVVAEAVEATDASRTTGWASTKDLITHLSGGLKGAGGAVLRLAEKTATLPDVRAAMLTGDLSPAQARAISRRVGTLPNAPELRTHAADVMLAQVRDSSLDATDLDRAFPDVIRAIDPDGRLLGDDQDKPRAERGAHHARHLSLTNDEVGGVKITGYACAEDAELIRTTLTAMSAPVSTEPGACGGDPHETHLESLRRRQRGPFTLACPTPGCGHTGRDPRDHSVRTLDALVELCRRAQAVETGPDALPNTHGTTPRVTVTIDLDDLKTGTGTGRLGSGETLSAHAVRRMACDADLIPAVLGTHGQVLDLGRTHRLVSTAIWLALVLRDRHCSFPGCRRPPQACDAHHIQHWADGGPTSLNNLTLLCRRHHTLAHHTPWTLHLDPTTRRPIWTPPPPRELPPGMTIHLAPPRQTTPAKAFAHATAPLVAG